MADRFAETLRRSWRVASSDLSKQLELVLFKRIDFAARRSQITTGSRMARSTKRKANQGVGSEARFLTPSAPLVLTLRGPRAAIPSGCNSSSLQNAVGSCRGSGSTQLRSSRYRSVMYATGVTKRLIKLPLRGASPTRSQRRHLPRLKTIVSFPSLQSHIAWLWLTCLVGTVSSGSKGRLN